VGVSGDQASLLLLPTLDTDLAARVLEVSVRILVVDPVEGPDVALATRTCAALMSLPLTDPVTVVAITDGASLLPAVARSLRARGHEVGGYVLIDPVIAAVSDTWPDAPVYVYCGLTSDIARMAGHRGWDVRDIALLGSCEHW